MRKLGLLDSFGSMYIKFVRDNVLTQMFDILNNKAQTESDKILSQKINEIPEKYKEIVEIIVQKTLDRSLHYNLAMLQEYEDDMELMMYDEEHHQRSINTIKENLCGELYGEEGWIKEYSKYPTLTENLEYSNKKDKLFN